MSETRLMRLKLIVQADFRKSEYTNYIEQSGPAKKNGKGKKKQLVLKSGEVVCLVSSRGDQIIFVYHMDRVREDEPHSEERSVLHSERLRLTGGGRWNPMMLGNYALQVGIRLEGIKLFEQHYDEMAEERKRVRQLRWAS